MEITVNNQAIKVQVNCFEQKYGDLIHATSITAIAPNGSKQECYWRYSENWVGSGVFKHCDDAFNTDNYGHIDFCNWLMEQTGCDQDEAIKTMDKILNKIGTSNQYTEDKEELVKLYALDTTDAVLEAGTMGDMTIAIYGTNNGRYIGVMLDHGNILAIDELSKAEYKAARKEAITYQYGTDERFESIYGAISKSVAAAIQRDC